jgi:group I intron endonuclease
MDKSKNICGIYKITNPVDEIYIGASKNISLRFCQHKIKSCNKELRKSFKKYGIDNHLFEILEECFIDELFNKECKHIKKYRKTHYLFNSELGRPATGRKKYTIMCHPCRIAEVRQWIKKLKPKK